MQTRLYERISGRLAQAISVGALRAGDRLPSVRELSTRERVSVSTVLQAYLQLEAGGLIEARPQSGHYVRPARQLPPEPPRSQPPASATEVSVSELVNRVRLSGRDRRLVPLAAAVPAPELLPWRRLGKLIAGIARDGGGIGYELPPGSLQLRRQLARRSLEWGCTLSPDDIVITSGAMEALQLSLLAVAERGDTVAVESPAYYGTLQLIEALGLRAVEIPTCPKEGLDLAGLDRVLRARRVAAVLVVANFSNPVGALMSDAAKEELVALCARRDVPLIDDDLYGDLHFGPRRPRALKSWDRTGSVLHCGSFSKTVAPGFRVGWCAPGKLQQRVELLKFAQTVATPSLQQVALAEFLAEGYFDRHVRGLRRTIAAQARQLGEAIAAHFPSGTRATRPEGGLSLWVELPQGTSALRVHARALEAGVAIVPGPVFSPRGGFDSFIRLSLGTPWSPRVEEAVATLGRIVREELRSA